MELFSIIYDFFYQLFSGIGKGEHGIFMYNSQSLDSNTMSTSEMMIKGFNILDLDTEIVFDAMELTSWLSLISTLIIAALLIFVAIKFIVWCFRIVGSLVALRGN